MSDPHSFKPEILRRSDIQRRAEAFLAEHYPSSEIPIPIERIIELKLEIHIVPQLGLKRLGIEGFLTGDLTELHVAEEIYSHPVPHRYRFTLAHEVGHLVLHRHVFDGSTIRTVEEWNDTMSALDKDDQGWLEWQAYEFAGQVLVPREPLIAAVEPYVERIRKRSDWPSLRDAFWGTVPAQVAADFAVSRDVLEKRIAREALADYFDT